MVSVGAVTAAVFSASLISAGGSAVSVPRVANRAPVIDGKIGTTEWEPAVVQRLPDGSLIRLQHDGHYLCLALTATRQGFPSVCAVRENTIRVLHASAALGSVTYTRSAGEWATRDTVFVYSLGDAAEHPRQRREAYLADYGWLASTFRMGGGLAQEVQISLVFLSQDAPRLAIAYFVTGEQGFVTSWPAALTSSGDGCADERLVRGYPPSPLSFRPDTWAVLTLEK
jgi:hypothetical protein